MLNGRPHIKVTQAPFAVGRYRTVAEMERALGDKAALAAHEEPRRVTRLIAAVIFPAASDRTHWRLREMAGGREDLVAEAAGLLGGF
jgi:hypothetical protein